jgi:predicted transcriptional regulator
MSFVEITSKNVNEIGNSLYKMRQIRHLDQKTVSERMAIKASSQVSGMENNVKKPGLRNFVRYLEALGGCKLIIEIDDDFGPVPQT